LTEKTHNNNLCDDYGFTTTKAWMADNAEMPKITGDEKLMRSKKFTIKRNAKLEAEIVGYIDALHAWVEDYGEYPDDERASALIAWRMAYFNQLGAGNYQNWVDVDNTVHVFVRQIIGNNHPSYAKYEKLLFNELMSTRIYRP